MPELRVKEKDLTTNASYTATDNWVLIADPLAEILDGVAPLRLTTSDDLDELTYPVVSKRNIKTYATGGDCVVSQDTYNFIKEVLTLGGKVLLTNAYSDSTVDFVSDPYQFNVKFLLVDEKKDTVDDDGNVVGDQSDLVNALAITNIRKDCVVILTAKEYQLQYTTQSICREEVNYIDEDFFKDEKAKVKGKYVGAFYGTFDDITAGQAYILAYLNSLSLNANNTWRATAGYTNGSIPGHTTTEYISQSQMNLMEPRTTSSRNVEEAPIAVNPILNIYGVGTRIFGTRTCLPNANVLVSSGDEEYVDTSADQLIASSFLTTRIILADIKKAAFSAYLLAVFGPDTDETWLTFTTQINKSLDTMVSDGVVIAYKWEKIAATERAKITALLKLKVVEPVEDFDVTIELGDTLEVSTAE